MTCISHLTLITSKIMAATNYDIMTGLAGHLVTVHPGSSHASVLFLTRPRYACMLSESISPMVVCLLLSICYCPSVSVRLIVCLVLSVGCCLSVTVCLSLRICYCLSVTVHLLPSVCYCLSVTVRLLQSVCWQQAPLLDQRLFPMKQCSLLFDVLLRDRAHALKHPAVPLQDLMLHILLSHCLGLSRHLCYKHVTELRHSKELPCASDMLAVA